VNFLAIYHLIEMEVNQSKFLNASLYLFVFISPFSYSWMKKEVVALDHPNIDFALSKNHFVAMMREREKRGMEGFML
jgi:hypothetical protein